jgi:nitrate/nitrite-specific signal transduction histidine kinase
MESQNISQGPHNSSMNPPLERHVRELQALYEIGQALSSVHDLDHLLQLAMERVVTLLDIESASSILLDEERDELYFKVAYDRRAGHEQDLREVAFLPSRASPAGSFRRANRWSCRMSSKIRGGTAG